MDENQALAAMCRAMACCPVHLRYILADINTMLLPPIKHQQYQFFEGGGRFGVVTWAFLNSKTAAKHVKNSVSLTHEEWKSGHDLWIVSLIGPKIKAKLVLPRLAASFSINRAYYLRRDSHLKVRKIICLEKKNSRLTISSVPHGSYTNS